MKKTNSQMSTLCGEASLSANWRLVRHALREADALVLREALPRHVRDEEAREVRVGAGLKE